MARGRTPWGSVRRLPSGRYQARYRVDVVTHVAPSTFTTKRDADAFLARVRTDIERGVWVDPEAGRVTLRDYATRWLAERPNLRPRTVELYEGELRLHILPAIGDVELGQLSSARVRTWHAAMLKRGRPGKTTVAKCYRLLSSIMATALEDGLIGRNPCVLKNAGVERPPERPTATVDEVFALADAIERRYRALVLTATFTGLRLGELRALKRRHLDLLHGTVHVVEQLQELADGTLVIGPPKSDAGNRTVAIPAALLVELELHLDAWSLPGVDELVFPGTQGQPFRRASLYTAWKRATRVAGVEGLRFHDLRHTGNTLAAATGASTKELMSRMGHASPRAALIYQHASRERDAAIAAALSDVITAARPAPNAAVLPLRENTSD
jgi:integrase